MITDEGNEVGDKKNSYESMNNMEEGKFRAAN